MDDIAGKKKRSFKGIDRMKWLCREKGIKKDKYRWDGDYAVLKQGQREKQEDLTGEVTLSERMDFYSGIWGSMHFPSHLIPKFRDEREINKLFKLTEN